MSENQKPANPLLSWWYGVLPAVNRWCGHFYRLAIVLGLLTMVGSPLHKMATRQADVTRTFADGSFEVEGDDFGGLGVGDRLPVFRFNPGWRQEIGKARITRVEEDRLVAMHSPQEFLWPLGLQGKITKAADGRATFNLGSNHGVKSGERFLVFENRKQVGSFRVQRVDEDSSSSFPARAVFHEGQVVSRFSVANQVSWMSSRAIVWTEWLVIGLVLALWGWSTQSPVPGQWLTSGVQKIKEGALGLPKAAWLTWHLLSGVLVVFVVGKLGYWALTFVSSLALSKLRRAGIDIPFHLRPYPEDGLMYSYALLGAVYLGWLFWKRSSPVVAGWKALAFKPPKLTNFPIPRYLVVWALHLVVFFAFTGTLSEVLVGNLKVVSGLAWRGAPLDFTTNSQTLRSVGYMLTHAPNPVTAGGAFAVARYALWSTAISVCMVGYLHTVVSILWKKPVRNVDFTLIGWLLNGICYGPLLGGVMHHSLPVVQDIEPLLSAGPWVLLQQSSELLLNVLYTLSLWNLGTMFGVMVDKGVRKSGFYAVVRHPSYTLEGLMFLLLLLPGFTTWSHWLIGIVFPIKYWIRSERDDIFMEGSNPDYTPYKQTVKYKLLPGIY